MRALVACRAPSVRRNLVTYDNNGCLKTKSIGGTTLHYEYDFAQRLVSMTSGDDSHRYAYNDAGIRVRAQDEQHKINNDTTALEDRRFLIDPQNPTGYAQVFEERGANLSIAVTYTIGDDVLTRAKSNNLPRHLIYDGHGSTRLLTNFDSGTGKPDVVERYGYDAYGNLHGGNPGMLSKPKTDYLYAGEQYDCGLMQYYLRARYYDPAIGRFNRIDPFPGDPQAPQSLHKYAYVHNCPVNAMDPTGMCSIVSFGSYIAIRLSLFAMTYAPQAAALAWTVTKIAGIAFLASTAYRTLAAAGWVPDNEIIKKIQVASGVVFLAGFVLTLGLQSVPSIDRSARGQVSWGGPDLSKQVQARRIEENISNSRVVNGAAFEYRGQNGSYRTIIAFSERGSGHAERLCHRGLQQMGIAPSQVTRVYSELQPCSGPENLSCAQMFRNYYPNVPITWSFPYQNGLTREQSLESIKALQEATKSLGL